MGSSFAHRITYRVLMSYSRCNIQEVDKLLIAPRHKHTILKHKDGKQYRNLRLISPSSKSIVVFPPYESWKRMTNRWRLKMPGKAQHYINALLSKIHTMTHRSGCDFRWLIPRIQSFFLKVFNPLLLKRVLRCMEYYWR